MKFTLSILFYLILPLTCFAAPKIEKLKDKETLEITVEYFINSNRYKKSNYSISKEGVTMKNNQGKKVLVPLNESEQKLLTTWLKHLYKSRASSKELTPYPTYTIVKRKNGKTISKKVLRNVFVKKLKKPHLTLRELEDK